MTPVWSPEAIDDLAAMISPRSVPILNRTITRSPSPGNPRRHAIPASYSIILIVLELPDRSGLLQRQFIEVDQGFLDMMFGRDLWIDDQRATRAIVHVLNFILPLVHTSAGLCVRGGLSTLRPQSFFRFPCRYRNTFAFGQMCTEQFLGSRRQMDRTEKLAAR